jgi:hypothetical protein
VRHDSGVFRPRARRVFVAHCVSVLRAESSDSATSPRNTVVFLASDANFASRQIPNGLFRAAARPRSDTCHHTLIARSVTIRARSNSPSATKPNVPRMVRLPSKILRECGHSHSTALCDKPKSRASPPCSCNRPPRVSVPTAGSHCGPPGRPRGLSRSRVEGAPCVFRGRCSCW